MADARSNLPTVAEMKAYIREQALARGADPRIAIKVAKSEGLKAGTWQSEYYKNGRRETSYGPFQLLVGGGLGDKFIQKTGLHPSDPSSWKEQIQFALDEAIKSGWGAWYGAAKVGVGKWDGLSGAQPLGITETASAEPEIEAADAFSILSPDLARPGSARIAESAAYFPEAPSPLGALAPDRPMPAGASPEAPGAIPERFAGGFPRSGPLGVIPTPGTGGLGSMIPPAPMQRVDTSGANVRLGSIPMVSPVYQPQPEMAAMRPPSPPSAPTEGRFAQDFGPAGPMNIAPTPGLEAFGTPSMPPMAPTGARAGGPFGNIPMVPPNFQQNPEMAAMQREPARAPGGSIPDVARVMAGLPISPGQYIGSGDVERFGGPRPTDGVPYSGPGSVIRPGDAERAKQEWMAAGFPTAADPRAPEFEGGRHRVGLGLGPPAGPDPVSPMMASPGSRAIGTDPSKYGPEQAMWRGLVPPVPVKTSMETRTALPMTKGFAMPVLPATMGRMADDILPELAGRSAPRSPRGRTAAPVRLDNPISVGQPGGRYGGTGLSAMMGVRSGMSPVGTVARSASNPDVMAVSLPHGNVAHVNTGKGFISTWSPADDDERGTVYGKVVAIDPTGSKYGYYSPGKAPKGWTTYGPGTSPGPGKGVSKSPGRSSGPRSGLLGLLSSITNQSRGPAAGPQAGPGGLLGSLFGGMFGNVGVGLGGGIGGGGGGLGGYGNPGFGGGMQNDNYSGL